MEPKRFFGLSLYSWRVLEGLSSGLGAGPAEVLTWFRFNCPEPALDRGGSVRRPASSPQIGGVVPPALAGHDGSGSRLKELHIRAARVDGSRCAP